jgi:Zn-dependent alcohol dehydrogenase
VQRQDRAPDLRKRIHADRGENQRQHSRMRGKQTGPNLSSTNCKRDILMFADLYMQGRLNLDDLVSKRIALLDVNDGYAASASASCSRRPPRLWR